MAKLMLDKTQKGPRVNKNMPGIHANAVYSKQSVKSG